MSVIPPSRHLITALLGLTSACAHGEPREVDPWHWEGVERVVVVGDLHGDYAQYMKVLRSAGLVSSHGRWTGGDTHLVQTGDVPDRGPDTRKIIDSLADLKVQAKRKGGRVHTLIGNHEAMNGYGDLRYTDPGEFAAFQGRDSERYREQQWEFTLNRIKQVKPETFLTMDLDEYRKQWEQKVPLGWVEHRLAWAPDGEYGKWIQSNPVAIQINGTIFVHGGIGPDYCQMSLQQLTEQAHEELQHYDPNTDGVIDDENGPLWYRGLATEDEQAFAPVLDQILDRYDANRIVVGHTPTGGVVWPRFDARVIVNDTGIAAYYGGNNAFLILEGNSAVAGYAQERIEIPGDEAQRLDYLRKVIALKPDNGELKDLLDDLQEPAPEVPDELVEAEPLAAETVSPGICQ